MNTALLPLVAFGPILVLAGLSDLRRMRIPNWTSLAAVALFVLTAPVIGWEEAGWRLRRWSFRSGWVSGRCGFSGQGT